MLPVPLRVRFESPDLKFACIVIEFTGYGNSYLSEQPKNGLSNKAVEFESHDESIEIKIRICQ